MARLVLSVVLLCLAVTLLPGALSQKYRKGGYPIEEDDEVWLVHFGPFDSRVEYLNPLTGMVNGFNIDVLNAVCALADKNCQVVYDLQTNCWDDYLHIQHGGEGVFNFYYDACIGWYPTIPRQRTFLFTESFSQGQGSGFAVAADNADSFDPTDLTGKTIGFIRGFFSDVDCIAMQGAETITGAALTDDQIVYYDGELHLKEAILKGEIDAAFDTAGNYHNEADQFAFLNDDSLIYCSAGGPAMMMRKDNRMKAWFDPALKTLLASAEYQEICDKIETEHGHKPGPYRDEVCLAMTVEE